MNAATTAFLDSTPSFGEAVRVRHIFRRYVVLKSVNGLKNEHEAGEIASKDRTNRFGRASGGTALARGALYRMLQNRIYRGEMKHKGSCYPGLHEAIIDAELWAEVQQALAENRVVRVSRSNAAAPSLLAGLVYDASGDRMSPTHANKKGTRYRYYVSQSLIKTGRPKAPDAACRVPAADLETIVEGRIRNLLRDEAAIFDGLGSDSTNINIEAAKSTMANAAALAQRWTTLAASDRRMVLQSLVSRIEVRAESIDITIRVGKLPEVLAPQANIASLVASAKAGGPKQVLIVRAHVRRTGMEMKLHIPGNIIPARREPDRSLLRLIGQARRLHDMIMTSRGQTIRELAKAAGVSPSYFTRVFCLSFLGQEIVKAILQGRQPIALSAKALLLESKLPPRWPEQRTQLGLT